MNRCTINEDDQFEVLGVVQQTEKKLKPNVPINKNDDKKYLAAIIADGLNMGCIWLEYCLNMVCIWLGYGLDVA